MRIGELFAGIGGASLAVSAVFPGAEPAWQADLVGEATRARRFPGAQQLVGDVRDVDPTRLDCVDLLTAGFPCQDLSVAGKGAGLDGARSGLYSEVLRFTKALSPERVLIENVPALVHYLPRLSADFRALGYGLTWTLCEAADAGHPHPRRRIFVLAELDRVGRGAVEVSRAERWRPEGLRVWGTPRAQDAKHAAPTLYEMTSTHGGCVRALHVQVATARSDEEARLWATPTASNPNETEDAEQWEARRARAAEKHGNGGIGEPSGQPVRAWPTPCSRDYKTGDTPNRKGTEALSSAAGAAEMGLFGRRLSPAWIEALMGYPVGWTDADLDCPHDLPAAVRGRYPEGWDRREPWPGFAWEPSRTLPDGLKAPGRAARLRALGNAWVPAQGALALRALLAPAQASLF